MKRTGNTENSLIHELNENDQLFNMLKAAFDSSYDGLCLSDFKGNIIYANKAAKKFYGFEQWETLKNNVSDWISNGTIDRSVTLEVIKQKKPVTIIQHARSGAEMLVTGTPIFDETGSLVYIISNIREVTALSRLREELDKTKDLTRRYSEELKKFYLHKHKQGKFIAKSKKMKHLLEMVFRVASVDSTVLVTGESGVGKTIIAKMIHEHSDRKSKPFIHANVAAIPQSLIEAELFGYSDGAFTGAKKGGKPGFFELANEGTLFLDEIGDIPLNIQVKLLQFIEEKQIVHLGGTQSVPIDVRILAATNRNLEDMIRGKKFRADLFFRLNVVPIYVPPLRNRKDDIIPLILHQLDRFNNHHKKNKQLTPEALKILSGYDYPGNVRELANLMERLVVLSGESKIKSQDLPHEIRLAGARAVELPEDPDTNSIQSLKTLIDAYEADIIKKALIKGRTQEKAAKILNVSQASIARKAKKYKIRYPDIFIHELQK